MHIGTVSLLAQILFCRQIILNCERNLFNFRLYYYKDAFGMHIFSKNKLDSANPKAFLKAYDLYASKIYRHVYFRVNSKETAEDIVSNVFLKTWEYSKNNKIENFKPFLYKIANNLTIDFYRQKGRVWHLEDINIDIASCDPDYDEEIDKNVSLEAIKKSIDKLSPEMRDILILRYIDGLSVKEISGIIQKSENSIYIATHRALKELKKIVYQANI